MRAARAARLGRWWAALRAVGLTHERWRALPPHGAARGQGGRSGSRSALVLVALFGVWKTLGARVAAVILLLVVPAVSAAHSSRRPVGKWITPGRGARDRDRATRTTATHDAAAADLRAVPADEHDGRMVIFTMMALGLNFVVGYAGLLDLGYVAFYAMGAYMAAGSRRRSSRSRTSTSARSGSARARPASTSRSGSCCRWPASPRRSSASSSACRRCACAATTSRSSRSASARSCRRSRGTATTSSAPASTSRTAPAGSRRSTARASATGSHQHLRLPAQLPHVGELRRGVLLDGARARADHDLLQRAPARLAARSRVDRDPRGRGRRGGDGRPADAHEDLGVRDGRVLRRRRRRVLRELQERRVPRRLLLPDLGLHPLHGHPRRDGEHLGRHLRRLLPRVSRPRGALEHRRRGSTGTSARTSTCRCTSSGSSARSS